MSDTPKDKVQVTAKTRLLFLEDRRRKLADMRASSSTPVLKRAQVAKELALIERLLALYRRSRDI